MTTQETSTVILGHRFTQQEITQLSREITNLYLTAIAMLRSLRGAHASYEELKTIFASDPVLANTMRLLSQEMMRAEETIRHILNTHGDFTWIAISQIILELLKLIPINQQFSPRELYDAAVIRGAQSYISAALAEVTRMPKSE